MPVGAAKLNFMGGQGLPTYSVSTATTSVDEGNSVTFTVTTTNYESGTLYWTTDGGTSSDFTATSGSVSITNNSGSFSVAIAADATTEGSETFRVNLRTVSTSGTIVANSDYVTINDTSLTPIVCGPYADLSVTATLTGGSVWGSNPYTEDSDFNVAAVHAGLLILGEQGVIRRTSAGLLNSFTGSTQNGITTSSYSSDKCGVTISLVSKITPEFPNGSFESGYTGWTVIQSRIRLNGGTTILGAPTPTDPTPNIYKATGDTTVTGDTYSYGLDTTDKPPNGGTQSLYLRNRGTVPSYGLLYGPAVYSTNLVTANVGDKISFWWRALGTQDSYNVYAYLLDPVSSPVRYIQLLDATSQTATNTSWAEASIIIQSGQQGNYYFVFINGGYDATGGTVVGSDLKIDIVKRFPAGTY